MRFISRPVKLLVLPLLTALGALSLPLAASAVFCTETSTSPWIVETSDGSGNSAPCACRPLTEEVGSCYCKFKADDSRQNCRGETTKLRGLCLDDDPASASEQDICAQGCIDAGYEPLNDSSGNHKGAQPDTFQFCDFDPANDCLGKTRNNVPNCFSCFCKYKAGTQPIQCVGKTVLLRYTAYQARCESYCAAYNYDSAGSGGQYESQCDYRTADGCAKPLNPDATGCKDVASANAQHDAAIARALTGGSVLTLPLPLSNTSIPRVVGRIMNALLGVVGGLALLLFVWGGMRWMLARGNPDEVGKAKKTIIWAALGLLAIFSSYAVLNFVITALRS